MVMCWLAQETFSVEKINIQQDPPIMVTFWDQILQSEDMKTWAELSASDMQDSQ